MSQQALHKAADLLLLTMGKLPPMDVDAFKKRVVAILGKQIARSYVQNLPYRKRSIGSNSAELNQVMAEFNIEVNWDLLKMARAFESVDQNLSVLNPAFNFTSEMQKYQQRARWRRQQMQLWNLPQLIEQFSDFSQIVLPTLMQRSLTFGGSVGKGIQIAAAVFSLFKKVLVLVLLWAVWTYMFQHHPEIVDELHDEHTDILEDVGVVDVSEAAPKLEPEVWIGGAIVLVIVIVQLSRFVKRLMMPDDPLATARR